jgi:hypothetical protein
MWEFFFPLFFFFFLFEFFFCCCFIPNRRVVSLSRSASCLSLTLCCLNDLTLVTFNEIPHFFSLQVLKDLLIVPATRVTRPGLAQWRTCKPDHWTQRCSRPPLVSQVGRGAAAL